MRVSQITALFLCAAATVLVLSLLSSCSGGKRFTSDTRSLDKHNYQQLSFEQAHTNAEDETQAEVVDISDLIAELGETKAPEGISNADFNELKSVFELALIEEAYVNGGKFVSDAPQGDSGRVTNLSYSELTGYLSWTYANRADYDLNGEVGIPDITPIASNYLLPAGTDALLNWIDGSFDGEIGIPDITPIAENYLNTVASYSIVTSDTVNGSYVEIARVSYESRINAMPPRFEIELPEGSKKYIRVRPLDSAGNEGALSNFVQALIPQIESISPLGGNEGESITFSAVVSGGGTYAYAWNFGGGADPNTSSEQSPTVTLLDGGGYSANLVVETEFGITQRDFTLNVIPKTYMVSGTITLDGNPLEGVTVNMTGQTPLTTNAAGHYEFSNIVNGDYTITPENNAYEFDPVSHDITVYKADYGNVNFVASHGLFDLSGTIRNDENLPMSDVALTLTNGSDVLNATTRSDGTFSFTAVQNGTYTLTPTDAYMVFTPATREIIGEGVTIDNLDYLAEMTHPLGSYPFKTGTGNNWVVRFMKNTLVEVYVADGTGVNGYKPEFYQAARDGIIQWNAVADRWGLFHLAFTDVQANAEISVTWVQSLGGNTSGIAQWSVKDNKLEIPITVRLATFVGMNQQTAQSVHDVATHEVGHALGIWDHSEREEDVMYPISYTGTPTKRDEYTMYVVYHTPATYTNDQGRRGGKGQDITWTME